MGERVALPSAARRRQASGLVDKRGEYLARAVANPGAPCVHHKVIVDERNVAGLPLDVKSVLVCDLSRKAQRSHVDGRAVAES